MTGKWNHGTSRALALAAVLALVALPLQLGAAEVVGSEVNRIATPLVGGGSLAFAPQVSFEEMTLTVAGGGHNLTQSFRSGQSAQFAPVDDQGFQLPDGTYNWELVASPAVRDLDTRAFKAGEISADGRSFKAAESPQGMRQSGVFTIKGGVIVNPRAIEAGSDRINESIGAVSRGQELTAAARGAEESDRDGN